MSIYCKKSFRISSRTIPSIKYYINTFKYLLVTIKTQNLHFLSINRVIESGIQAMIPSHKPRPAAQPSPGDNIPKVPPSGSRTNSRSKKQEVAISGSTRISPVPLGAVMKLNLIALYTSSALILLELPKSFPKNWIV